MGHCLSGSGSRRIVRSSAPPFIGHRPCSHLVNAVRRQPPPAILSQLLPAQTFWGRRCRGSERFTRRSASCVVANSSANRWFSFRCRSFSDCRSMLKGYSLLLRLNRSHEFSICSVRRAGDFVKRVANSFALSGAACSARLSRLLCLSGYCYITLRKKKTACASTVCAARASP